VTTYFAGGRNRARYTTNVTSNPDGSGTYTGEATATSGTGAYAGAKGRLSMTGSITAMGARVTGKVNGTLIYGR
jgi:hypothetical protein